VRERNLNEFNFTPTSLRLRPAFVAHKLREQSEIAGGREMNQQHISSTLRL